MGVEAISRGYIWCTKLRAFEEVGVLVTFVDKTIVVVVVCRMIFYACMLCWAAVSCVD